VARIIFNVLWEAPSSWITVSFERASICLLRQESGGRGEFRLRPDASLGEYHGAGHLTVLAASQPITLRGNQMRRTQMACLLLKPQEVAGLNSQQIAAIRSASSRIMFRNDRLQACAQLLTDYEGTDGADAYAAGLAGALLAALLDAIDPPTQNHTPELTGQALLSVFNYIDTHLSQSITNDDLARVAGLSSPVFSHAFREVTGMSPPRWQMDARVRLAQRLMFDNPAESLANIASRAGFSDQSHFSRAFFDIMGMSPSAWVHHQGC
jgi:AraC-like DNA-binding protein